MITNSLIPCMIGLSFEASPHRHRISYLVLVFYKPHYHKSEILFRRTLVRAHNERRKPSPMPAKTVWFLKIREIVEQLEAFDVPVLDRALIEQVFGLRRRQAIELFHRVGGYQADRTFLMDRSRLIEYLRRLAEGDDFLRESRRQERLSKTLDELRRNRAAARVKLPVPLIIRINNLKIPRATSQFSWLLFKVL